MDDNTAVIEKSAQIHEAGMRALESGKIDVFGGLFSMLDAIKDRFFVGGFRGDLSVFSMQRAHLLMRELDSISHGLGQFHFFQAGREYPLHFTLGEGKYLGGDRAEVFAGLKQDPAFKSFFEQYFEVGPITFDTLVVDKANLLLTASRIPPEIVVLRNCLAGIYERHGVQPIRIENLLHMTLARIDRLENESEKRLEQLRRYAELIQALRVYIKCYPIVISGRLRISSSVDFFHGDTDLSEMTWGELLRKCYGQDSFWCRLSGFDGSDHHDYLPHLDAAWACGEGNWREGRLTAERIAHGFAFHHPGFCYPSCVHAENVRFEGLHEVVGKRAKIRTRT